MEPTNDNNSHTFVELEEFSLPNSVIQKSVFNSNLEACAEQNPTLCDVQNSESSASIPTDIVSPTSPTSTVTAQIQPMDTDLDDYLTITKTPIQPMRLRVMSRTEIDPSHDLQYERDNKWITYITNPIFCARLFALLLLILLLTLCITYCIAQLLTVKLELVKKCNPKTNEEIWRHSYLSGLIDSQIVINKESQYGLTDDSCWTTNTFDANTDQLWFSNKYHRQWTNSIDLKFILFALMALYCFVIIIYNVFTVIMDIYYIKHNKIHTRSIKYKRFLQQQKGPTKTSGYIAQQCTKMYRVYSKYMATDTTGWIIRCIVNEMMELTLQTQALLLYNGYNVFGSKDNVYLANKANYIILFAVILAINAFGAGLLWLSYALAHKQCHGLVFRLFILCIDQFCDLFYVVFPFITVFTDSYNQNSNDILILLGQSHIDSGLAFVSAFFPLFLLCTKSLFIVHSAVQDLRNTYYQEWKRIDDLLKAADDKETASKAVTKGPKVVNTATLSDNDKKLYDADGNVVPFFKRTSKVSWINLNTDVNRLKQIALSIISLIYIVFGIIVLVIVNKHIETAETYCNSIREANYMHKNGSLIENIHLSEGELTALNVNPELFFWDKCLYQTYPFVRNERHQCQCRVFVIDWNELHSTADQRMNEFNLTQNKILKGMLEHWVMLEKFYTKNVDKGFHELKFAFTTKMFRSLRMKAFEWNSAGIDSFESGISSWKELEYLKFEQTAGGLADLPSDFDGLTEMKYLSFMSSGIASLPSSICSFNQLTVLQIEWEPKIISIPHCIGALKELTVLIIDGSFALDLIPISIFNLPQLVLLSLFKASISYQSLLDYNLPIYIDINDTYSTNEWMNDNFKYNDATEYYLSVNPICSEDNTTFPSQLKQFISGEGICDYLCDITEVYDTFCSPRFLGNGRCDLMCSTPGCRFDEGDCTQLCFAPELANCSLNKLNNNHCDDGCNNKYCSSYEWGSSFENPNTQQRGYILYSADSFQCPYNDTADATTTITNQTCTESGRNSIYVDIPEELYTPCDIEWIGDGECDDSCRTEECSYDLEDCSVGCVNNDCHRIYEFWLYFIGADTYKISYSDVCLNILPVAVSMLGVEEPDNCSQTVEKIDYNMDKYVNFREFSAMAYDFSGSDSKKGAQINCSACIGMQYYNV